MITQVIAEYMRIQHIKGSIINIFRAQTYYRSVGSLCRL